MFRPHEFCRTYFQDKTEVTASQYFELYNNYVNLPRKEKRKMAREYVRSKRKMNFQTWWVNIGERITEGKYAHMQFELAQAMKEPKGSSYQDRIFKKYNFNPDTEK